ncbi:MAG: hypothetical protein ABIG44_00870 [Planctomycetota bacterium]
MAQPTCFKYFGTSYSTNQFLIGQTAYPVLFFDPCRELIIAINERLPDMTIMKASVDHSKLILMGDYGWWTSYAFNDPRHFEWHQREDSHCVAFLDGHADFIKFTKGQHVAENYIVLPFDELIGQAADCQPEDPCP